jgi:argininosuccinate synthase
MCYRLTSRNPAANMASCLVRPKNQFSLTRAALSTCGSAKNQILISKNVTCTARMKLYKGNLMCAGPKSPVSPYNPAIATMEADPTKAYNQDDATGFIRLNALRLKVAARVQRRK